MDRPFLTAHLSTPFSLAFPILIFPFFKLGTELSYEERCTIKCLYESDSGCGYGVSENCSSHSILFFSSLSVLRFQDFVAKFVFLIPPAAPSRRWATAKKGRKIMITTRTDTMMLMCRFTYFFFLSRFSQVSFSLLPYPTSRSRFS